MLQSWTTQEIRGLVLKGINFRSKCPRVTGLSIENKKRSTVWSWQRRVNGTARTIKLGVFPQLGIADARAKAAVINEDLANGIDVYVIHGAGTSNLTEKACVRGVMKCQDAWDTHIARSGNKISTKQDEQRYWNAHWKSVIGEMKVTDVTYDDLMDVIEDLREEGKDGAADVAIRYIKKFFSWAEENPRLTGLENTPAGKLRPDRVKKRDRFFSDQEIRWFWEAASEQQPVWRDYFLTLLLTGQRRNEIRLLTRSEVESACINFPPERMKNNERHLLPLGPLASRIISRRLGDHKSRFVFQSPVMFEKDAPIGGLSKALKKLRAAMDNLAGVSGAKVEHWTIHDLRRTFATGAANIRGNDERRILDGKYIERVLSHKIIGVEAHYNHSDYFPDKRHVLSTWENRLSDVVGVKLFEVY